MKNWTHSETSGWSNFTFAFYILHFYVNISLTLSKKLLSDFSGWGLKFGE